MIIAKWTSEYKCDKIDNISTEWNEKILKIISSDYPKYPVGMTIDFTQILIATKDERLTFIIQPIN